MTHLNSVIDRLERESFSRYCAKTGHSVEQVQAYLLPIARAGFLDRLRLFGEVYGKEQAEKLRARFADSLTQGYLELNRAVVEFEREYMIAEIQAALPLLPVNYDYLRTLTAGVGLDAPRPDSPLVITDFLSAVPTVNLYDHEFNAFVSGKTVDTCMPAVCVYPHLFGSLHILIDLVLPAVIEPSAEFRSIDASARIAASSEFLGPCCEAMEIICCERFQLSGHEVAQRLSYIDGGAIMLDITATAGWSFVWHHEYGHLLMGHLQTGAHPDQEHEADAFARTVLVTLAEKTGNYASWMLTGAIFLMVALWIIEKRHGLGSVTTHPPTMTRLDRLIAGNTWRADIARRVSLVCGTATQELWGFDIPVTLE